MASLLLGLALLGTPPTAERFEETQPHMGTQVTIVAYAAEEKRANEAIAAAFARIVALDQVLSNYKPDSEVNRLTQSAPHAEPIPVSQDLWNVLSAAQTLSRQSKGGFDVTVGPLSKLWRRARRQQQMPAPERLGEARRAVGFEHMRLVAKGRLVQLERPGMSLDLGGIAKGYIVDQALAELQSRGLAQSLVNAGGDMAMGAAPPGEAGWKVAVAPLAPDAAPSRILRLSACGVATSGDAFQFVEIDGKRYSHIIDPRSGLGLTLRSSVTVIAADCMTADGLASAISVLGPDQGLGLLKHYGKASSLVVFQREEGKVEVAASPGFAKP